MTIPILKNIPLAPIERSHSRRKYQFEQMEVGDMFFAPGSSKISTYVSAAGSRIGKQFRTRRLYMRQLRNGSWRQCEKDADGAIFGTGVWRIG